MFEPNFDNHFCVFFKYKYNPYFKFSSANKPAIKLKKLIDICYQNLFHAQNLSKQANDKRVKP